MKTAPGFYTFDGFGVNAGDEHKSRIATITPARFWPTPPEEAEESRTTTAQLLAASQELYNACLAAYSQLTADRDVDDMQELCIKDDECIQQLMAAIDKAEGRS